MPGLRLLQCLVNETTGGLSTLVGGFASARALEARDPQAFTLLSRRAFDQRMKTIVSFRRMEDGTREDYLLLDESERDFAAGLPDRVLAALGKLDNSLEGYPVTRLEHSLQVATRAEAAHADEELVLGALLHDIGDVLAPYNHAEVAAGILRPYVSPEVTWIVEQHGLFQTYYYVHHLGGDRHQRERLKGHRWYDACVAFCEWDQASFDPDFPTRPLAHFEPLLRRILSRPAHDLRYVAVGS